LTVVHQDSQSGPPLVLDYLLVDNGQYRIEAERPSAPTSPAQGTSSGSPSPSPSSLPSGKPPIGGIVGGVVGALAVIVLAVLAFLWMRMRRKRRDDRAKLLPRTTISLSHPDSVTPLTTFRKGDVPGFASPAEESLHTTSTPARRSSVNPPSSTASTSLTSSSTTRRKGSGFVSSSQASEAPSLPRLHQDSGIRLTPNRRSSLPPVYTAD
jgi:hypothetical protein